MQCKNEDLEKFPWCFHACTHPLCLGFWTHFPIALCSEFSNYLNKVKALCRIFKLLKIPRWNLTKIKWHLLISLITFLGMLTEASIYFDVISPISI